jgi:hypothetical protein
MKDSGGNRTFVTGSEMLNAIVSWIKETLNLPAHGMPMNAFHLFIDGSSRESVEVWEILKNAAAMQDAMLKQCRIQGTRPTLKLFEDHYSGRIPLPWYLPTGFSQAIREVVHATSNIHFTGVVGELWDQDMFFFERRDWTLDQCGRSGMTRFLSKAFVRISGYDSIPHIRSSLEGSQGHTRW